MKLFEFLKTILFHYLQIYFFKPLGLCGYLHTPGLPRKSPFFSSRIQRKACSLKETLHTYGSSFCQPNLPPTVESVIRVPNTALAIVLWMKKCRAVTRRWRLRNGIMRKNSKQEDVMNVIMAIDDYLWVETGDEGPYDGASIKATILGISYRYMHMHVYWLIFIV